MAILTTALRIGTRAAQPAASAVGAGTVYSVSDESYKLEQSNGTAWGQWGPTPAAGGSGDLSVTTYQTYAWEASYDSGGSAGIAVFGCDLAPSISGTQARSLESVNVYNSFTSVATASATTGWRVNFALTQQRFLPTYDMYITAPDVLTSVRFWVGLSSAQFTDADTHAGHCAAFRFSSVAGDTGWRPITRDGTTQQTGTNIGTVVAGTRYRLTIRFSGTKVSFSVDGGTEQDITSNIPGSTTDLGIDHRIINQANAARVFKFSRSRLLHGA